ncbi:MAG: hypothetical protein J6334_00205 [Kiritimatiellae bacterium]|nr:hypothetical protein [Kiritimatiellia bacterium]
MRALFYAIILLTGAGVIVGASFFQLLAAAAGACLTEWILALRPLRHETVFVTLDPESPKGEQIVEAFRLVFGASRRANRTLRLRITNPESGRRARFTLIPARDGELTLQQAGQRDKPLNLHGRWIADHPLPLHLPNATCMTLFFSPTDSGRVRVSLDDPEKLPLPLIALLALLTLAALLFNQTLPAAFLTGAILAHFLISLKTVPIVRKSSQQEKRNP